MIVPSHFVPLASPGIVQLGLRWMWNPESPFYVRPRVSADLLDWGWKLHRAATQAHVDRAAPVLRDLHLASRDCYREWAALWNNAFELTERGMLMLCNTEHGLEEERKAAEHARRLGIAAEVLTPAATAELEPNLRMAIAGSVYFPEDCHLAPERLMAVLAREVERAGVQVSWETGVDGWRSTANRIEAMHTNGAQKTELVADEYVVCSGIWSQPIAARSRHQDSDAGGQGIQPDDEESCKVAARLCHPERSARCGDADGQRTAIRRDDGTCRPRRGNQPRARARHRQLSHALFSRHDVGTVAAGDPALGPAPCSPDGLPYVGRVARFGNLSVATGHAMMGISLGPITGKLISEILSDEAPSCSIEGLSPDRYA